MEKLVFVSIDGDHAVLWFSEEFPRHCRGEGWQGPWREAHPPEGAIARGRIPLDALTLPTDKTTPVDLSKGEIPWLRVGDRLILAGCTPAGAVQLLADQWESLAA